MNFFLREKRIDVTLRVDYRSNDIWRKDATVLCVMNPNSVCEGKEKTTGTNVFHAKWAIVGNFTWRNSVIFKKMEKKSFRY